MSGISISEDELFILFKDCSFKSIDQLCRINPEIKLVSEQPRFKYLIETKLVGQLPEKYEIEDSYPSRNQTLIEACRQGNLEDVMLLLRHDADPSYQNNLAIIEACRNNHLDIVDYLLADPRVDPSDQNNQAIVVASLFGDIKVVDRLLDWCPKEVGDDPRVDPSSQHNQAIAYASQNGHLEIVNRLLLDPRVDPTDTNNQAIILASENGHLDVVNRLLDWQEIERRVDPSVRGNMAIIRASRKGHLNVVNRLLEWINFGDCSKVPKDFWWALYEGQTGNVSSLRHNIYQDLHPRHVQYCIEKAKQGNHTEIVNLLSQYYISITNKSNQ